MLDYKELLAEYGSPLYLYDLDKITIAFNKLKNALPDKSIIYYSLKANPNPEVTRHLITLGCYAEVSSSRELDVALGAGAPPYTCLYTGPGKTKKEIEYALLKNVTNFSVESLEELRIISELSKVLKNCINIILRVNPSFNVGKASIKMTGTSSQFGFDEETLDNIPHELFKSKNMEIRGIHIYNGSNFNDINILKENFKKTITTINNIRRKIPINLDFVDLGGGFAASFGKSEELIDYSKLKHSLNKLIDYEFYGLQKPLIAFESGRYLTASSGVLIGTVQSTKISKGRQFYIVDFGINHIGGMGSLGRIPTIDLQLFKANSQKNNSTLLSNVTVVGPLCTPLDYLAKNITMPIVKPGDIVYVNNVGAYGLTASLLAFLSRDIPKEVIIKGNKILHVSSLNLVRE